MQSPHVLRARFFAAMGTVISFILCVQSHAVPILPGGAFSVPAEPDPVGGVVVAGGIPVPFISTLYSGTLTTTVIRDDPSNPFAGIGDPNPAHHGLTFVFQLHNDITSTDSLGRFTSVDFGSFSTDVSYQAPTADQPPTSVDRSFGPGSVIGWTFKATPLGLGEIAPGANSALLVVQTNSPFSTDSIANVIDGSPVQVATIGPDLTFILPEPASLMVISGVVMLTLRRKRTA